MKHDGHDVSSALQAIATTPKVFHRVTIDEGRSNCAVYLTMPVFGKPILEFQPQFNYNTLEIYAIRLGEGGIHAGYFFRSPLKLKLDPYYVLFHKRGVRPINDLIKHPVSVEKRHVIGDLVFHVHELSYMITRLEDNSVTEMLAQ